jgi:hypothetical protein
LTAASVCPESDGKDTMIAAITVLAALCLLVAADTSDSAK